MSLAFVRPSALYGVLALSLAYFGPLALSAQNKNPAGGDFSAAQRPLQHTLQMQADPSSRNCPVSMHAQQNGWGGLVKVQHGPGAKQNPPSPARQQIRLRLEPSVVQDGQDGQDDQVDQDHQARVMSAKVLVRGTSARQRAVRTSTEGSAADIAKTLDLVFRFGNADNSSASLVLDGFTSVTSILPKSIAYADGHTWTASPESSCRTVPDPLMLVAGQPR